MVSTWRLGLVFLVIMFGHGHTLIADGDSTSPLPFQMTHTPTELTLMVTENVALRCESNRKAISSMILRDVSRVRILRKTDQGKWELMAEQLPRGKATTKDDTISASGRVIPGAPHASFLEIRWALAERDTFGVYRCDIIGTDDKNEPSQEQTVELELQQTDISNEDVITMLLKTRSDIEKEIQENANNIETMRLSNSPSEVDSNLLDAFLLRNTTIAWPGGEYALIQPESGCPVDLAFFGGNSGYFRIHTESSEGRNANNLHRDSHLSQPSMTQSGSNYFLNLRFCVVTRVFSTTPWPEGNFCIHMKGAACPVGFESGQIHIDTEDHRNSDLRYGNVPFNSPTDLMFCCKHTGNPKVPMVLPTESPFYLYRYGGKCQQVQGMRLLEEFVEIDTENDNNHDYKEGTVADSDLESYSLVRIELCYYFK